MQKNKSNKLMQKQKLFRFKHFDVIHKDLGVLIPGIPHLPFFTHGRWSMHEMLLYLLSVSGPANVTISSFSLSDLTIQAFSRAIKKGYILKLDLLLNTAVKRNKLNLLMFADNVVNRIGLAHTHMKVTLIENDSWKIALNQSANSTINPAWEAGVISTDLKIFDIYDNYIKKAFSETMPIWNLLKKNSRKLKN